MSLKEALYKIVEDEFSIIEEISEFIFAHPELGNQEVESSKYLVEVLQKHGFTVTYPYLNLPTAFRAEFHFEEHPQTKVALLAEYDALPGYGPNKNENAHACGHNWIAANTCGAAIALSKMKEQITTGSIVVIGTPAEETVGGKYDLVERGAFSDIDAALQMHLGAENNINVITLAMDSLAFEFHGKAAHAAAYPHLGVNALDGAQLMFAGINALRQHIRSDARVAGIIVDGGQACNTVPDYASCRFYMRARTREYLEELTQRIIQCAQGAALMSGTTMSYYNFENSYDNLIYHEGLRNLLKNNLQELGIDDFIPCDAEASGSSDIGNVSQVCPTVYCEIKTYGKEKVYAHEEAFLDYVHGEQAVFTLKASTKAMAATALSVLLDPSIVKEHL